MRQLFLGIFFLIGFSASAQIVSPDEFLGYELGTQFTPHYKVVGYFKQIASSAKNIKLEVYGKTYEGRELLTAVISEQENIDRLEQIRKNNLLLSKADKSAKTNMPSILWLSYNVHGNEANSTETSMKVLYTLATADSKTKQWLKNVVVVIDPCLNPDGRDRYVNNYNAVKSAVPNPDPTSREHSEPWPGGRPNHYYFDLNRDWAWQSQIETQQRLANYHKWMPQVHVDFHEQSYNDPYYFAPAAEPVHADITQWQKDFQITVGKNNAKYFDEQGWKYFTKERFDLLYPSYGDTYPLYNGAIGMTYEQGGIRAGLAVITNDGDTLTLKDRIQHHFTTSMSTLEVVSANASKLVSEFKTYFEQSATNPPGPYKTYVVKAQNLSRTRKLAELLAKNGIAYAFGAERSLNGFNFETQKTENVKIERNDLIINLQQPRSVLANVLFEPQTKITDSNTYDITAWALPYIYGLNAYGLKESLSGAHNFIEIPKVQSSFAGKPYALVVPWRGVEDARLLMALQQEKIKVRIAEEGFTIGGKVYPSGTLLVYRTENEKLNKNFLSVVKQIESDFATSFFPIASGYVEKGKDFGSNVYRLLGTPKIGALIGDEVSSTGIGEVWHYFEQELKYPLTMINTRNIGSLDISKINTLIIPDGSYSDKLAEQLAPWVSVGGKLILMEDAIGAFVGKKDFEIKKKEYAKETPKENLRKFGDKETFEDAIPGAIYRIGLDQTNPLCVGLGKYFYAIKTDDRNYELLQNGRNIGLLHQNSYVSGIAGVKVKAKLNSGVQIGTQRLNKGNVIYISPNILFRSFSENGKQLFNNALFLVQ